MRDQVRFDAREVGMSRIQELRASVHEDAEVVPHDMGDADRRPSAEMASLGCAARGREHEASVQEVTALMRGCPCAVTVAMVSVRMPVSAATVWSAVSILSGVMMDRRCAVPRATERSSSSCNVEISSGVSYTRLILAEGSDTWFRSARRCPQRYRRCRARRGVRRAPMDDRDRALTCMGACGVESLRFDGVHARRAGAPTESGAGLVRVEGPWARSLVVDANDGIVATGGIVEGFIGAVHWGHGGDRRALGNGSRVDRARRAKYAECRGGA